ncbi:hypothetical protein SESBI_05539 [Sesbania bispinosa]|nr:hypothetical protein SESBI_05539 [Sesbania bispinosa]
MPWKDLEDEMKDRLWLPMSLSRSVPKRAVDSVIASSSNSPSLLISPSWSCVAQEFLYANGSAGTTGTAVLVNDVQVHSSSLSNQFLLCHDRCFLGGVVYPLQEIWL